MNPNELYVLNSERPLHDSLEDLDSARVLNSPQKLFDIHRIDQPLRMQHVNESPLQLKPTVADRRETSKFPVIEEALEYENHIGA